MYKETHIVGGNEKKMCEFSLTNKFMYSENLKIFYYLPVFWNNSLTWHLTSQKCRWQEGCTPSPFSSLEFLAAKGCRHSSA